MNQASVILMATAAGLAVTYVIAAGCGHEPPMPATTMTTGSIVPPPLAPASPGKPNSSIYLSDRLRTACAIQTIGSVTEAPKFDFDQSTILAEDRDVLAEVARCLTTGPLKGRTVQLVGRADPRGGQEYNMALGERRSNAVLRYLSNLGVSSSHLTETSRGALDATGNDEATWRQDRRVDVDVVEELR